MNYELTLSVPVPVYISRPRSQIPVPNALLYGRGLPRHDIPYSSSPTSGFMTSHFFSFASNMYLKLKNTNRKNSKTKL